MVKRAKIGLEISFFAIVSILVYLFSLKLHTMIACNNVLHLVEVKSLKNIFEPQIWASKAKIEPATTITHKIFETNSSFHVK